MLHITAAHVDLVSRAAAIPYTSHTLLHITASHVGLVSRKNVYSDQMSARGAKIQRILQDVCANTNASDQALMLHRAG